MNDIHNVKAIKWFDLVNKSDINGVIDMIKSGIDVNVRNGVKDGCNTALLIAVMRQDREMVKLLIDSGASKFLTNYNSESVLSMMLVHNQEVVCERKDGEVVTKIINCKEGVESIEEMWNNSIGMIEWLVELGVDINTRGSNGDTLLHKVMSNVVGDIGNIIEWLVAKMRIDVNIKNNDGNTALHLYVKNGCNSVIKSIVPFLMLVSKGNPNIKNNKGRSVINYACKYNHKDLLDYILRTRDNKME